MAIVATIARRFLLSKSSDRFISLIAWVAVCGVALGVLALTTVTSVINGFEGELTKAITGMNGDAIIYSRGNPVSDPESVMQKVRSLVPELKAVSPSFVTEIMVSGPGGVSGAVLDGADLETFGDVSVLPKRLLRGRMPKGLSDNAEIVLGEVIADKIGADVGGEVRLIAPFAEEGEAKIVRAQVVGVYKMGMYQYDSKFIISSLPVVQKFLAQPERVTSFKISLKPGADSDKVSALLKDSFGYPFKAKNWGELNHNLLYAIQLEKVVIAIILTAIVIVAAFNVVSTLMMMVHDKTQEISALKAMGFRRSSSFKLFCIIGMGIGTIGTLVGVLLGLGANWIIANTNIVELPADVYHIDFLPVVARWGEILMIVIFSLLICLGATLYPAIKVALRSPLDGLRYE